MQIPWHDSDCSGHFDSYCLEACSSCTGYFHSLYHHTVHNDHSQGQFGSRNVCFWCVNDLVFNKMYLSQKRFFVELLQTLPNIGNMQLRKCSCIIGTGLISGYQYMHSLENIIWSNCFIGNKAFIERIYFNICLWLYIKALPIDTPDQPKTLSPNIFTVYRKDRRRGNWV